jgi:hypothetical protein
VHQNGAADGLAGPNSVAVSQDGEHVYISSSRSGLNSVAAFSRNSSTGKAELVEIESDGANGVGDMSGIVMAALNPGGSHVFVITNISDSVVVFQRDGISGKLDFVESVSRSDLDTDHWDALWDPRSVSASPDGAFIYVANKLTGSIGVFKTSSPGGEETGFRINPGLNGSWFNPATNGQGFLIEVLPQGGKVFLAWFTYDNVRPPQGYIANLGEPGHRWLTAQGPFAKNQAVLDVWMTAGGEFDSPDPKVTSERDGEIILEFSGCTSGTVSYDIPSIGAQGIIPIQRIALDNVSLCETLMDQ